MSIKLIVEVLDHAPADITSAELAVMIVIAENANDTTRTGWPGMDLISRRTRLKPDSVQKVLRKLAARGIEMRVPIGKDKAGNLVYAAKGHRSVYTIPPLQSPDDCPPFRPAKPGPRSEEGRTTVRQSPDEDPTHPLNEPSNKPSSSSSRRSPLVAIVLNHTDATEEEAIEIIRILRPEAKSSLSGYLKSLGLSGDLQDRLNAYRNDGAGDERLAHQKDVKNYPDCEHGCPGGHKPMRNGWVTCPWRRREQEKTGYVCPRCEDRKYVPGEPSQGMIPCPECRPYRIEQEN